LTNFDPSHFISWHAPAILGFDFIQTFEEFILLGGFITVDSLFYCQFPLAVSCRSWALFDIMAEYAVQIPEGPVDLGSNHFSMWAFSHFLAIHG
jgi:hypothetical protein